MKWKLVYILLFNIGVVERILNFISLQPDAVTVEVYLHSNFLLAYLVTSVAALIVYELLNLLPDSGPY